MKNTNMKNTNMKNTKNIMNIVFYFFVKISYIRYIYEISKSI